jgi:signal peptidase I
MGAAPSLNCVARSEQREKPPAAGHDLNARIQAQVAARRRKDAPGEVSVAALLAAQLADPAVSNSSSSVNGAPVNGHARAAVATGRHGLPSERWSSARARTAPTGHGRHGQLPQTPGRANRLARLAFLLVLTLVAVLGLRSYVIASYYIPSASMETTLHGCPNCEPDMVLVDKLSYRVSAISRTDVVVFNRPPLAPPEDKQLIKRVIGLPGDVVSGHDGHVYIGSRQLVEPYVNPACHGTADFPAVTVPAGRYFMMGDNRCDSFDSRMFGTIPRSSVVGRAFAVIWPVKHLRWL